MYRCDWCLATKPPKDGYVDDEWPEGWSNLDELGNDDLLCDTCLAQAREAIQDAFDDAKAARTPNKSEET
jgi:hypothetical protein